MKERIIQETLALFRSRELRSIKMDDVSKALGISKRTLYQYFDNKETLFRECVKYRVNCEGLFEHTDQRLLDMLYDYYRCFLKQPGIIDYRCCQYIRQNHQDAQQYLLDYISQFADLCREKVKEGIEDGYIKKEVSANLVYVFLLNHFTNLFSKEPCCVSNYGDSLMADFVLTFIRGISTLKGRGYLDKKLKDKNQQ